MYNLQANYEGHIYHPYTLPKQNYINFANS